jgi:hypothetical protein
MFFQPLVERVGVNTPHASYLNGGQSFSIDEGIDGLTADPQLYCDISYAQKVWLNGRKTLFSPHKNLLFSITNLSVGASLLISGHWLRGSLKGGKGLLEQCQICPFSPDPGIPLFQKTCSERRFDSLLFSLTHFAGKGLQDWLA